MILHVATHVECHEVVLQPVKTTSKSIVTLCTPKTVQEGGISAIRDMHSAFEAAKRLV